MSAIAAYKDALERRSDMQGHVATLYDWVLRLRPRSVIELGVRHGVSTAALLAGLEYNEVGTLWSCDIERKDLPVELTNHPRWQFALGDDRHPEALDPPPPEHCQLLFIDTSHTAAHTRRELALYGKRVDPGGVVLAHDVDMVGCGRAVREWSTRDSLRTYCYGLSATLV